MAELLLGAGAVPNARNDRGITPLHLAAYPNIVEILVRRGADITARVAAGCSDWIRGQNGWRARSHVFPPLRRRPRKDGATGGGDGMAARRPARARGTRGAGRERDRG